MCKRSTMNFYHAVPMQIPVPPVLSSSMFFLKTPNSLLVRHLWNSLLLFHRIMVKLNCYFSSDQLGVPYTLHAEPEKWAILIKSGKTWKSEGIFNYIYPSQGKKI